MKNISRFLVLPLLGLAACTFDGSREETASTDSELTTLTAQQCRTPSTSTVPKKDASGQPIDGTARTSLNGCMLGNSGETGRDVMTRASALLGDSTKLGKVTNADGERLFTEFTPGATSGSLTSSGGLVQDVSATLNVDYSPKTQLRITRKLGSDGTYSLNIVNTTPVNVTVGVFSVDVVKTGNLKFSATLKPEANGISVAGASEIELEEAKERAAELSKMVQDVFAWMTKQLSS